jgi:hypothetical protein
METGLTAGLRRVVAGCRRGAGLLALLGAAGWLLRPLAEPAWQAQAVDPPAGRWRESNAAVGQGLALGLLGGFRAVIADFLWLQTNACWEECDAAGTRRSLELVTAIDPRPLTFWLNGARMLGYDMPGWRVAALGGESVIDAAIRQRIEEEQAQAALAFLARGLRAHPQHPLLLLEVANLHLHRRRDVAAAADLYRRAAEQPRAPQFAARIYAELLRQLGRDREAYAWLVALHPRLPTDEPAAAADLVLERIRTLEAKLAVPPAARYRPGRAAD